MADLSERSDDDLLAGVARLVVSHRRLTAELVAHLGEIEERRLHLVAGFSSMFDFCQKKLGMSEGEAFRRIVAARLGRRFPVVHRLLASGAVGLSTLELVREWLTDENHAELFAVVAGKGKREVQAILAARFPRPDAPSRIRLQASIEPLSEGRFRVEFTASEALVEKLEHCRDLMSHANPSRDLGAVVERAVDLLVAELERKRLGRAKRPRVGPSKVVEKPGRIANATRRRVFERDGAQCTYVSLNGRRCDARAFLELDHVEPRAFGGGNAAENLRVRCRAHNQLWAEEAFGREKVEQSRGGVTSHFRQQKCERRLSEAKGRANELQMVPSLLPGILEKVAAGLGSMGFRDVEVRRAIAEIERRHDEPLTLERALRKAILVATAKAA